MRTIVKPFEELSNRELYEILRLRMDAFIVEQGGRYQDLDRVDYRSTHIFYLDDKGHCAGCIRLFEKADEPGTVQLGRLVIRDRKQGLGHQIMDDAARIAREQFGANELYLTGRKDAYGFYVKCGYHAASEELMAETVPYYQLRKTLV